MCRVPRARCVDSCVGVSSGYYHSCSGCNKYVKCVGNTIYRNLPCPFNRIWDDSLKRCVSKSVTCKPCSLKIPRYRTLVMGEETPSVPTNDDACTKKGGVCVDICKDNSACQQGALYAGLCAGAATRRCCIPESTGVRSTVGPALVRSTVEPVTFAPVKVKPGKGKGKAKLKES